MTVTQAAPDHPGAADWTTGLVFKVDCSESGFRSRFIKPRNGRFSATAWADEEPLVHPLRGHKATSSNAALPLKDCRTDEELTHWAHYIDGQKGNRAAKWSAQVRSAETFLLTEEKDGVRIAETLMCGPRVPPFEGFLVRAKSLSAFSPTRGDENRPSLPHNLAPVCFT